MAQLVSEPRITGYTGFAGAGEGVRDERYESASNLYAYLDDVRIREEHENAQASDSSRDAELPVSLCCPPSAQDLE